MEYTNRRKPGAEHPRRGVRLIVLLAAVVGVAATSVFALTRFLGPFPFGISRRDTTLLTLWNEGRYRDVLSEAEEILASDHLDPQALTLGGFAHFYIGIDQVAPSDQQFHMTRAVLLLRKAQHVPRSPLAAERDYVLGKTYYHLGHDYVDLAVDYMSRSVDAGYIASDTYSYLGLAHGRLGDIAQSAEYFELGIEAEDSAALRLRAAEARRSLGEYDIAEQHLASALNDSEDEFVNLLLSINLAKVHIDSGRLADAESMLEALVETRPESADALYYLGVVYDRTDRPIEARSMWRRARDLDPNHEEALESLANGEG